MSHDKTNSFPAAFGRLCVETAYLSTIQARLNQPPSGGCVLKHHQLHQDFYRLDPAAFGRLCVETVRCRGQPAGLSRPAAFGRLCVETIGSHRMTSAMSPAAFGRLCVETNLPAYSLQMRSQPPSGGCVLKHRHE